MISANDFKAKQIIFLNAKDGEKICIRNDNVMIIDNNGEVIHQSTCYRLFAIFVVGNISVTNVLFQRAKKFGFSVVFMTTSLRPYAVVSEFAKSNVLLRKNQYSYQNITAAKKLIINKIENQYSFLNSIRIKNQSQKDALNLLQTFIDKVNNCKDIFQIMGVEGNASRTYFKNVFNNVLWSSRKPRVKQDMVNSLLDTGYTLLFSYVDALASVFGFDSYVGILHRQFYMRKSLICDLVEPFRVIIDKCIRKGINLNQFKEEDFEIMNDRWIIKYNKKSEYNKIFISEIMNYRNDIFLYVRSFYRSFMKNDIDNNFPVWRFHK